MDKIKKTVLIFLIYITISSCNRYRKDRDNIIFTFETWTEVNLKSRKIEIEMMKYKDTLVLSTLEEQEILSSFQSNEIGKLRGEIYVSSKKPIRTPIIDFSFKIYKANNQIADVWINNEYYSAINSETEEDKIANFRDTVKRILKNNRSFKNALHKLDDYVKQNNIIRL